MPRHRTTNPWKTPRMVMLRYSDISAPGSRYLRVHRNEKPLSRCGLNGAHPKHKEGCRMSRQHQQNVKWFGSHNWTTQQLWTASLILPDAPRCSEIGWGQSDELSGAPQCCGSCGREYKNILKNVWLSSKCYKIKLLECENFGAIRSIGRVSKTIPVHLEPGAVLSRSDYYNVYIK